MKLFTLLGAFFLTLTFTAQSSSEWTEHTNQDGLIISYKLADCDMEMGFDETRILFKIENTNAKKALVVWQYKQYYDDVCRTCDDPNGEYRKEFSLEPGVTLEGKCSVYDTSGLMIFSKWVTQPNKTKLSNWELADLNITFYDK